MGYPMALCCRCYGFYLGTAISSISAITNKLNITTKVFIFMLIICIIDITINLLFQGQLNTGNITRFVIGILMGIIFVHILNSSFNIIGSKKDEKK